MPHSNLIDLYQYYSDMKFFGSFSIDEVDNMIIFERDVYRNQLETIIKKHNKINNSANQ